MLDGAEDAGHDVLIEGAEVDSGTTVAGDADHQYRVARVEVEEVAGVVCLGVCGCEVGHSYEGILEFISHVFVKSIVKIALGKEFKEFISCLNYLKNEMFCNSNVCTNVVHFSACKHCFV